MKVPQKMSQKWTKIWTFPVLFWKWYNPCLTQFTADESTLHHVQQKAAATLIFMNKNFYTCRTSVNVTLGVLPPHHYLCDQWPGSRFLRCVIQCGFVFYSWGSRVLPCSPSRGAEVAHSSPGPMLPQSTTASLRTLEYSSAAEQGSRARGDKRTDVTYTQTQGSSVSP